MSDFIRCLVSGPKARFKDHELDLELDLVYVTDRIIVMGYPAIGLEGLYRNRREDAKKFLDHRHGKNYWVYNLCPIKENSYESSVFEGRVTRFPFPDHHAPPLALLPLASREIHAWLDGSPDRVAVLHCKAGKGRSGTMACTYLLTLDSPPTAPSLNSKLSAHERASLHADETMRKIPDEGLHPHASNDLKSRFTTEEEPSDMADIIDDSKLGSPLHIPQPPPNPERSFTDSLKGVLDLHTARRMKSNVDSERRDGKQRTQRQGVSIPSQRRWLYYWALLLEGEAPADVLNHHKQTPTSTPRVCIKSIQVRMRERSGVARGIVHATNAVLSRTSKKSEDSAASAKEKPSQLWASISRYDDRLIDRLEEWEARTRHEKGGLAKRQQDSTTMYVEGVEHDLSELFGSSGEWDAHKMVRSFARFGLRGCDDETLAMDEGEKSKVRTSTLRLLTDKRRKDLKTPVSQTLTSPTTSPGGPGTDGKPSDALEKDMQRLDTPRSEATSINDETSESGRSAVAEASQRFDGLIVDPSRELRVKLYAGKVFIGWFWFIPSFHIPSATSESTSANATFHLTRKDLDFALGLGADILDVDIDMEWLPKEAPFTEKMSTREPVVVQSGTAKDDLTLDDTAGQETVAAGLLQASLGSTSGLRDAVNAGQATKV